MKTKISLFFLISFFSLNVFGAKIDTLMIFSEAMQKEIPTLVVTPENYTKAKTYPTVYLLHGYSGNYTSWATGEISAVRYADTYDMILVMPDGGFSSWYFDSPIDPAWRYETFVSKELIRFIDTNYSTNPSPKSRAISGLSMGGHGALYLAFRHQDVFGAAGSMSGGVDIRPFPLKWDMAKKLGPYAEYPENWEKNTIMNMIHLLTPHSLDLIIDCGTEDFFYDVNCKLHEKLLYNNIPHDFISRPGAHNAKYWGNAVKYQLLFFNDFFSKIDLATKI
ncbi:esterase family protein [Bacteroidales bacterium OttesenSCG-928-A17]|nr:esterase family protein [Bacteroidales bacterium OttesenSCG-928-A17]